MNFLITFKVAFRALARNKMRSALTMLGIIIGVAAVIAMVSVGQGAQASIQDQIASMGTNMLMVGAGSMNMGGVRSGTGTTNTNTLTVDDIEAIKRECPSVAMATPSVRAGSQIIFGNQNWNTSLQGVNEEWPKIRKWLVQSGEFFNESDIRTANRVVVLGQTIVDNLFPGVDPAVPMLMLDGDPGQWLFWHRLPNGHQRASVVISAHHREEPEAAIAAATLAQLQRSYQLPAPIWQRLITEKRATYACTPVQRRLLQALPAQIGRIYFAGDWCVPELPATLESAVLSGERAVARLQGDFDA